MRFSVMITLFRQSPSCSGIQTEIEQFECLINRHELHESALQAFFEEHPHFLGMLAEAGQPIAHPYLRAYDGNVIIPDFVLKPVVAARRDSRWKVIDLKMPFEDIIVGKNRDARLSHNVLKAIRQLHRYRDYFRNTVHQHEISGVLGHSLKYPKLAVLIGKTPRGDLVTALDREQAEYDVETVTYDEVLETQREVYNVEAATRRSIQR